MECDYYLKFNDGRSPYFFDSKHNCYTAGVISGDVFDLISSVTSEDTESIRNFLLQERQSFSVVLEAQDYIFAAVDRVRSYPVFFDNYGGKLRVSYNAMPLMKNKFHQAIDQEARQVFLKTGYCMGRSTLIKEIQTLKAGEYLLINKKTGELNIRPYFRYQPELQRTSSLSHDQWHQKLEKALDSAFQRTIEQANGNTIWIPLSAGYDSRAVLAKLDALGYDNIQTFSYGTKHNMEAQVARDIASKCGVPWRFIDSNPKKVAQRFQSSEGDDFMLYCGSISAAPALTEYATFVHLNDNKLISDGDLIVNGQAGDFLTGGHIPVIETRDQILDRLYQKHCSTLNQTASYQEQVDFFTQWAEENNPAAFGSERTLEELYRDAIEFEWQERQSRYVANQQRVYDYFGVSWSLPLWDADLIDLYIHVPLDLQIGQALYLGYLKKWNYKGLFEQGRLPYNPWSKHRWLILGLARVIGLLRGQEKKNDFYQKAYYYSDLHFQYGLFGLSSYLENIDSIRSPVSLVLFDYLSRMEKSIKVNPH